MKNEEINAELIELVEGPLDDTSRKIAGLSDASNDEHLVVLGQLLNRTLLVSLLLFAGVCLPQQLPKQGKLDAVYFETEERGFVRFDTGTSQIVYATENGGRTWRVVGDKEARFRRGRVFVDDKHGWSIVEDPWPHKSIYSSDDGGKTWRLAFRGDGPRPPLFEGLYVYDEKEVWVVGTHSFKTNDGGRTWTPVPIGGASIQFLKDGHGWALDGRSIWKTDDRGNTWQEVRIPDSILGKYTLWDLYFLDSKQGWAVGGDSSDFLKDGSEKGIVLYTRDGGKTWTRMAVVSGRFLWSVFFISGSTGWAGGANGTLAKTIDGGKTWSAFGNTGP